jgi:hypothetical protein
VPFDLLSEQVRIEKWLKWGYLGQMKINPNPAPVGDNISFYLTSTLPPALGTQETIYEVEFGAPSPTPGPDTDWVDSNGSGLIDSCDYIRVWWTETTFNWYHVTGTYLVDLEQIVDNGDGVWSPCDSVYKYFSGLGTWRYHVDKVGEWTDPTTATTYIAVLQKEDPDDNEGWRHFLFNILHQEGFYRGDVNKDGNLNISDVIYMINYLFKGGPKPIEFTSQLDVNCDGETNVSDVIYTINYLFKGGLAPIDKNRFFLESPYVDQAHKDAYINRAPGLFGDPDWKDLGK